MLMTKPCDLIRPRFIGSLLVLLLSHLLSWPLETMAETDRKHFFSLYAGRYSDTALIQNLQLDHDFQDSHVYVVSIGQELGRHGNVLALELEGQFAIHRGRQNHQEINCAVTLRWLPFPWDQYVDTSFAFGNGLSYATADPPVEIENADNGRTAQWLYYILAEWAFAVDDDSEWEVFWRIHHRSGVYGLMADNNAGSNYMGLGLRKRF